MNFSALPRGTLTGRIARWPLSLIPGQTVLPVLQGPVRGARWIVGSSTHGCWLGSYEQEKVRIVRASLRAGVVFFDVGAQAGYYSILAARYTMPGGRVYAFEPLPRNLAFLRRHRDLNLPLYPPFFARLPLSPPTSKRNTHCMSPHSPALLDTCTDPSPPS